MKIDDSTGTRIQVQGIISNRVISQVEHQVKEPVPNTMAKNECDSNADTCCLGKNFVILNYTRRTADVYAYDKSIEPIENVPIVCGASAYDDPKTGKTYILIINEGLYYRDKLDLTLINPNQVRDFGIPLWDNPYDKDKSLNVEINDELTIPLHTKGTKIYFNSRSPTPRELEDPTLYVDLTSTRSWNPEENKLGWLESSQYLISSVNTVHASDNDSLLYSIELSLVVLQERMIANVKIKGEYDPNDLPSRNTLISHNRHAKIDASTLAHNFGIGLKQAYATIKVTTQKAVRSAILPISWQYRADRMYQIQRLTGKLATDTLYGSCKSLCDNIASQIYSHKCGFSVPFHMTWVNAENVGYSLGSFIYNYGVPERLTFDGAAVQVGSKTMFMDLIRKHWIKHHVSAPRRPNENPAEGSIREIKKCAYRVMVEKGIPDRLWDYVITWVCETGNICANSSRYSIVQTPLEIITGETPDISEYMDFGLYDWVTSWANAGMGPTELGCWLGVSHRVGQMMSYWILPKSGIPISCVTVQHLTYLERQTDEWRAQMEAFLRGLETKFDAVSSKISSKVIPSSAVVLDLEREDQDFIDEFNRVIDNKIVPQADYVHTEQADMYHSDPYLNMELGIRRGDDHELIHARVKRRAIDVDGKSIGTTNENPLLDSRAYEIECLDGSYEVITANIIAENLFMQVDDEGQRQLMLEEIIDYWVDSTAVPIKDSHYFTKNGLKIKKHTT